MNAITRLFLVFFLFSICGRVYALGEIDVKTYGAIGNGINDDSAAIARAVAAAFNGGQGLKVYFPPGAYRISRPIVLERNVDIVGTGIGWGSVIKPDAVDGIHIDGDKVQGGWAFKNSIEGLNIDMSRAPDKTALRIHRAYSVRIESVYVHNPNGGRPEVASVNISKVNHVTLQDLSIFGGQKTGRGIGLLVDDGWVTAFNINVEGYLQTIVVRESAPAKGKFAMYGGHVERFGQFGVLYQGSSYNLLSGSRILIPTKNQVGVGFQSLAGRPSSHNMVLATSILAPNGISDGYIPMAAYDGASANVAMQSQLDGLPANLNAPNGISIR